MITELKARDIALQYLANLEDEVGEPLMLVDSETLKKSFGWVFFYNSREYLEKGEFSAMLAGNAPFIVDKSTGALVVTGTEKPFDEYIADIEKKLSSL